MRIHISDFIRKVAAFIELEKSPEEKGSENSVGIKKPHSNDDTVESEVIKPTAMPKIKPPRRDPVSKPSDWDSKEHRRNYMREWRAEGRDIDTGNRYVKKSK